MVEPELESAVPVSDDEHWDVLVELVVLSDTFEVDFCMNSPGDVISVNELGG